MYFHVKHKFVYKVYKDLKSFQLQTDNCLQALSEVGLNAYFVRFIGSFNTLIFSLLNSAAD